MRQAGGCGQDRRQAVDQFQPGFLPGQGEAGGIVVLLHQGVRLGQFMLAEQAQRVFADQQGMARIDAALRAQQRAELLQALLHQGAQLRRRAVQTRPHLFVAAAVQVGRDHGALGGAVQSSQGRNEDLPGARLDGRQGGGGVLPAAALAQARDQAKAQDAVDPGPGFAQVGVVAGGILPEQHEGVAQDFFGVDAPAQHSLPQGQHGRGLLVVEQVQRQGVLRGKLGQ